MYLKWVTGQKPTFLHTDSREVPLEKDCQVQEVAWHLFENQDGEYKQFHSGLQAKGQVISTETQQQTLKCISIEEMPMIINLEPVLTQITTIVHYSQEL